MNLKLTHALCLSIFILIILASASAENIHTEKKAKKIFLESREFTPAEKVLQKEVLGAQTEKAGKSHILIQFDHIPSNEEKEQLKEEGITLLDYIPENAWLASVEKNKIKKIVAKNDVTFYDSYTTNDKVEQKVKNNNFIINKDGTADFYVLLFSDVSRENSKIIIESYGTILSEPLQGMENIWLVRINPEKLQELSNEDSVEWIEAKPLQLVTLNDGARSLVGANIVQASPYGLNGTGVVVAEWDAGWANHTDYYNKVTYADTCGGSDSGSCSQIAHSTHVAGTMLGNGSGSAGASGSVNQWRGIATNASLISYEWPDTLSELYSETNNSTGYNAVLSQNSWGMSVTSANCNSHGDYDSWSREYDAIVNKNLSSAKAISVVFAAGNEEDDNDCGAPANPWNQILPLGASAKNTITVGAVYSDTKKHTTFSSRGPTEDGRIKPDLSAPGSEVSNDGGIKSTWTSNSYSTQSGTSMAAPVVSGIIALIHQDYRTTHSNADPLPSTVKAILIHTASDQLGDSENDTLGPDFTYGWGIVNATNAIDLVRVDNETNNSNVIIENNVSNAANVTYNVSVPAGQNYFKVTLVWDDYAGTPAASKALVNNLDLIVTAPNGSTMYPWTLSNSSPSSAATRNQTNSVDNVEQVYVESPGSGIWVVVVNGTSVPEAPETFSLVSTNALNGTGVIVSIESPVNFYNSSSQNVNINCSATSPGSVLKNISLYANFTGTWNWNETVDVGGFSNYSVFNKTLNDASYIFNCEANNTLNNNAFFSSNRTLTVDTTPPASVLNLNNTTQAAAWVNWSWTNPSNSDYNHVEIYLNGTFKSNVSSTTTYINITGLTQNTTYEIETITVDNFENRNTTAANNTTRTYTDNVAPAVTLNSPANSYSTTSTNISFNCSAEDNYLLGNISLFISTDSTWNANETVAVGGSNNYSVFNKTLAIGTYYWNCQANDTLSNSAFGSSNRTLTISTVSDTGSSGGGGGGGGRGVSLPVESQSFGALPAGSTLSRVFSNSEQLYVSKIILTSAQDIKNAIITVIRYNEQPASVSNPDEKVFAYLSIEPVSFRSSELSSVKIEFLVNKSWIQNNNFDELKVVLLRSVDRQWTELPTIKSYVVGSQIAYVADSPGLSVFAISAKKKTIEQAEAEKTPAEKEATAEVKKEITPETQKKIIEVKLDTNLIYIFLFITIFIVSFIIFLYVVIIEKVESSQNQGKETSQ